MTVQLPPRLHAQVQDLVATGEYADAEQVIEQALRLLADRQRRLAWLRAELAKGEEQEKRGELIEWTPGSMDRLVAEAKERARLALPVRDAVKP